MNRITRISDREILWIGVVVCWLVSGTAAWGQATFKIAEFRAQPQRVELEEIRNRAKLGDAEAQVRMGHKFYYGYEVAKSNVEAASWYRKAAGQGNVEGQYFLGVMYDSGYGIDEREFGPQNQPEATNWFHKAAKGGSVAAQMKLAIVYAIGLGVDEDAVESVKWYSRAAMQGNAVAQIAVGLAYFTGSGVSQNDVLAYTWLHLSARQMEGQIHPRAVGVRRYLDTHLTLKQMSEAQILIRQWQPKVEKAERQIKTEV